MAKYFFHLRDGEDSVLDDDGIALDGPDAVAAQALVEARSILSHDIRDGRIDLNQRIDVLDESGERVHTLHFIDAVEIVASKPR